MRYSRQISLIVFSLLSFFSRADDRDEDIHYEHINKVNLVNKSIHILKIDPQKFKPKLVRAKGQREEVSSIARRSHAVAAINGGNYRRGGRYNGNQVGLVKIEENVVADSGFFRGCIGFSKDGLQSIIGSYGLKWQVVIGNQKYFVDKINQLRSADEIIIYDRNFGMNTPITAETIELIVKNNNFKEMQYDGGANIPKNGFVISYTKSSMLGAAKIKINDAIHLYKEAVTSKEDLWQKMDYILGGAGLLVEDGEIVCDFENEFTNGMPVAHDNDEIVADFHSGEQRLWLTELQHPRTAVGLIPGGTWVIVVVDGRSSVSSGMSLYELAKFMKDELKCKDALNLGGGGCSTLYLKGTVINNPSGDSVTKVRAERPVSEAIVFTCRSN